MFKISVKNSAIVTKALQEYGKKAELLIDDIVKNSAQEIAFNADIRAPKKSGDLARSIVALQREPLTYAISTNVSYAPYQEFGTGRFAREYVPTLPESLQRQAAVYKGKGIRDVNIPAKKFIWNSVVDQEPILRDDIIRGIEALTL